MEKEVLRRKIVEGIDYSLSRPFFSPRGEDREVALATRQAVLEDDGTILGIILKKMGPRKQSSPDTQDGATDMAKKTDPKHETPVIDDSTRPDGMKAEQCTALANALGCGEEEVREAVGLGFNPVLILQVLLTLKDIAPEVQSILQKLSDAWKRLPMQAAADKGHCPAGERCCDAVISHLTEALCHALHCKRCCSSDGK